MELALLQIMLLAFSVTPRNGSVHHKTVAMMGEQCIQIKRPILDATMSMQPKRTSSSSESTLLWNSDTCSQKTDPKRELGISLLLSLITRVLSDASEDTEDCPHCINPFDSSVQRMDQDDSDQVMSAEDAAEMLFSSIGGVWAMTTSPYQLVEQKL